MKRCKIIQFAQISNTSKIEKIPITELRKKTIQEILKRMNQKAIIKSVHQSNDYWDRHKINPKKSPWRSISTCTTPNKKQSYKTTCGVMQNKRQQIHAFRHSATVSRSIIFYHYIDLDRFKKVVKTKLTRAILTRVNQKWNSFIF